MDDGAYEVAVNDVVCEESMRVAMNDEAPGGRDDGGAAPLVPLVPMRRAGGSEERMGKWEM